jgi:hypothetical protein
MLLELRGIRKSFGPVNALAGVDFEIDRGAFVGRRRQRRWEIDAVKVIAGVPGLTPERSI